MAADDSSHFQWVVVGGGPCGIIAVALLVERILQKKNNSTGVEASNHKIAWIDPYFRVGNLPRWREVQANSSVQAICSSFDAIPSLRFREMQQLRASKGLRTLIGLLPETLEDDKLPRKLWCELGLVVDALEDATMILLRHACVVGIRAHVVNLVQCEDRERKYWQVEFESVKSSEDEIDADQKDEQELQRGIVASFQCKETETIHPDDSCPVFDSFASVSSPVFAYSAALAPGALPKSPPPSFEEKVHIVDLETAIISANLRSLLRWTPPPSCLGCTEDASWHKLRWTVVGSSHSAMLSVRNLIGLGIKKVQIVHHRPLFYVEPKSEPPGPSGEAWLKNIGTGLLGTTGSWCRKELPLLEKSGRIEWKRFPSSTSGNDEMEAWVLSNSDVVIFAAGFASAQLPSMRIAELASPTIVMKECNESQNAVNENAVKEIVRHRSRSPRGRNQRSEDPSRQCLSRPAQFHGFTGIVGLGIGFPEQHVEPDGDVDVRVGFVRHYIEYASRVLGLGSDWLQGSSHTRTV